MKPMLAANLKEEDLDKLNYPVIVQPKLDGVRCLVHPELGPVTRQLKPIPNDWIRTQLKFYKYCDGEITVGNSFQQSQSAVMTKEGTPDFTYHGFDYFRNPDEFYVHRQKDMITDTKVMFWDITNKKDLLYVYEDCLEKGYEGIIIRSYFGKYKYGRSTLKEQYLLKYKPIDDDEAIIYGFEEKMHNDNPPEKNKLGRTERSTKKENMIPTGTLGALKLLWNTYSFKIGTGFDDKLRQEIWDNQDKYLGKMITFEYQGQGSKGLPRFPVFKDFRKDLG